MLDLRFYKIIKCGFMIVLLMLVNACATTKTVDITHQDDVIEPVNRVFFNVNETLDKYLLKPTAKTYVKITPDPVRKSVTHFFDNLAYPNVILNSFLQGKVEQGASGILRVIFNSSFGIGGLFDVATPMGMPKHKEDFGQTLAVWGVGRGAYLYLPFYGPNTVRHSTDFVPSTLLNPFFYLQSTILLPFNAVNIVNKRANLLTLSNIRDNIAIDSYAFTREAYLQQRQFLIYDGNPPMSDFDFNFDDLDTE